MNNPHNEVFTPRYQKKQKSYPKLKKLKPANPEHTWIGKMFNDWTDADKQALAKHLNTMDREKSKGYRLYLQNYCDMPKGIFDR